MVISATAIGNKVWDIRYGLIKKYGVDEADRLIAPLEWYINTGRASAPFLRKMLDSKTAGLVKILEKDGSTEKIIKSIKEYLDKECA